VSLLAVQLELPALAAIGVLAIWWLAVVRPAIRGKGEAASPPRSQTGGGLLVPLVGLGVAASIWHLTERTGPAVAVLVLWTGFFALLRARTRGRIETEEERHALEAISTASRVLRAGIPLSGMLSILAEQAQGEAGRTFREISRRERLGEDLSAAVRHTLLASRQPSLRAFGLALEVHLAAGGNLAEAGDRLAKSLLERSFVRRRAKTILAYGRLAAGLLTVFPVIVVAMMSASVAEYWPFLVDRPEGNLMMGIAALLVVAGLVTIERIGRFDPSSREAAA
jgi:Flp pilus assembly protein TadB